MIVRRDPRPRRKLQRGIIIIPSTFTLANLFFGVFAMVMADRGEFIWAGWFIVFAGVLDMLDGRVARFTSTGSRFGAELDSLVDAISFGVAPAMIMYRLYLGEGPWNWLLSFVYVTAVVVRLARFNVEQGGEAKRYFHGLPSPTAGMILATWYPFTQTRLFEIYLGGLPWPQIMGVLMILLSALMLSHVPYALFPRLGFGTPKARFNTVFVLAAMFTAVALPRYYWFPALWLYTVWGLVKSVILGFLDRLPDKDPLLDEPEDDESGTEPRSLDYGALGPPHFSRERGEHMDEGYPEDEI